LFQALRFHISAYNAKTTLASRLVQWALWLQARKLVQFSLTTINVPPAALASKLAQERFHIFIQVRKLF
jgi:hypothetical protein